MKKHLFLLLTALIAMTVLLTSCNGILKPVWPSFNPPDITSDEEEGGDENDVVPEVLVDSEGLEYELVTSVVPENEYYKVIGRGTCTDEFLVIPKEYEGKPVRQIGAEAFMNDKTLCRVYISENIVLIDDRAFAGTSIEIFEIPDNVKMLGEAVIAFSPVREIVIGKSLTLNTASLCCSTALENITVHEENKSLVLRDGVLYRWLQDSNGNIQYILMQYPTARTDKSFTIPEDVSFVMDYAFSCANTLEEIDVESNVLLSSPFLACENLKTVKINVTLDELIHSENHSYVLYSLIALTTVVEEEGGNNYDNMLNLMPEFSLADIQIVFNDITVTNQELLDYARDQRPELFN